MTKTKRTLSAIDAILAQLTSDGLRPDEFTAAQAFERHRAEGGERTAKAIREALDTMVRNGGLVKRLVLLKGKRTGAYSVKQALENPSRVF